jgi:hypothetical protein
MVSGAFELGETKLLRDLLQDVDILVNVGTNVGYLLLPCSESG